MYIASDVSARDSIIGALHHVPSEHAEDMSWHAIYQRLALYDKGIVDGDHDIVDAGSSYISPPSMVGLDPSIKLDACSDGGGSGVTKKTKLKAILLPDPSMSNNNNSNSSNTQQKKAKGKITSNGTEAAKIIDNNTVVALYSSVVGIMTKKDVVDLIEKRRVELDKGTTIYGQRYTCTRDDDDVNAMMTL